MEQRYFKCYVYILILQILSIQRGSKFWIPKHQILYKKFRYITLQRGSTGSLCVFIVQSGVDCLSPGLLGDNFETHAKSCSSFLQSCSPSWHPQEMAQGSHCLVVHRRPLIMKTITDRLFHHHHHHYYPHYHYHHRYVNIVINHH